MSKWKECKIGELGRVITGTTPASKCPEQFGNKMPFVTPSDYKNYNKWIAFAERSLSEKGIEKLRSRILPANSILVTCIGSDMGKVAINKVPVISNQQINSIIVNENIDANFLYYKLVESYDTLRKYGEAGTAVPIVNKGDFENIAIEIPTDKNEQIAIAEILSSLDDKIDLLHRQNKTLEQLAETLFRKWFVVEADESWEEDVLENYISFDPREKIDRNKAYQFFEMKCLSNVDMNISDGVYRIVSSASSFRNFDTLLAKITPCLENGKTGFVMHLGDDEVARGSTEFIVMRSKGLVSPYWIYCLARDSDFREKAIQSMTGTSGRQRVQIDLLKNITVKVDAERMKKFHDTVSPFFLKIKSNQTQIKTLTKLRDALLPKLVNGEVRVQMN